MFYWAGVFGIVYLPDVCGYDPHSWQSDWLPILGLLAWVFLYREPQSKKVQPGK
jgi:hypothetical protein